MRVLRKQLDEIPNKENRWNYFEAIKMRSDHFETFGISECALRVDIQKDPWLHEVSKEVKCG